MVVFLFLVVCYLLMCVTMMPLFSKAGVESWKALVPGLNFFEMSKLVGRRSGWYALWMLFPVVNIFIYTGLCVDMVRSFGKLKYWHTALAVLVAPVIFYMIGKEKSDQYEGPILTKERDYMVQMMEAKKEGKKKKYSRLANNNPFRKSVGREWAEAIFFAVFAAAFIRMFLIEAYKIPTPSMEGSLLVGDFLFVSKAHYGIRTPMTIAMIPLLHNRIPGIDRESYLKKPKLPYFRLPALEKIERNTPVVFNYPEGDSVYVGKLRAYSHHDYKRRAVPQNYIDGLELASRPIDKRDHYIKRCIGVPGDSLEIRDKQVYINGAPGVNPDKMQFQYRVTRKNGSKLNKKRLFDLGVNLENTPAVEAGYFHLNDTQLEQIEGFGEDVVIEPQHSSPRIPEHLFPHDPAHFSGWTMDNFGPIYIPEKGKTVSINSSTIALYSRIIDTYEDNDLSVVGDKILINGEEADSYTFKMNYYWMMGDNRHNSEDSRVWGYVPEDHVVGKPLFIWFSTKSGNMKNGINWDRLFTSASK